MATAASSGLISYSSPTAPQIHSALGNPTRPTNQGPLGDRVSCGWAVGHSQASCRPLPTGTTSPARCPLAAKACPPTTARPPAPAWRMQSEASPGADCLVRSFSQSFNDLNTVIVLENSPGGCPCPLWRDAVPIVCRPIRSLLFHARLNQFAHCVW